MRSRASYTFGPDEERRDRGEAWSRRLSPSMACVLALALLASCSSGLSLHSSARETEHSRQGLVTRGERVVVLPFREGSPLPPYGNHVMCHLTGEHLDAGDVPKGTGEELGEILAAQLTALDVDVVPYDKGLRLLAGFDRDAVSRYEPALGVELARRLGAPKAILGVVSRYEERSGAAYASGTPARVSFSLALVEVKTGAVTHRLAINREQAPLTSNLFSFATWWRRGFRWWSRQEVAEESLATAARALVGRADAEDAWASMASSPGPERPPSRQSLPQPPY